MAEALIQRLQSLEVQFFAAVRGGSNALAAFNSQYVALLGELQEASAVATLPQHVLDLARTISTNIIEHSNLVRDHDTQAEELICDTLSSDRDGYISDGASQAPASSLPLFRYFLANVCHPYPDAAEKERIVEDVRRSGWRDFDKRKLEDWLNRKRNQCGFVAILRTYCGDNREEMRRLCQTALYGSHQQQASLPAGAVDDVEDMREFLQSQHDDLADERDTTWVDNLTTSVEAVLGNHYTAEPPALDALSDDYDSDCSGDDDVASCCSSTDVEDDDEDEEPPRIIIGAKRKLAEQCDVWPPSRPLSRSLSMASSVSSSSTACSLRSFSGASLSSTTSVDWDDDDDPCARPTKRVRNASCTLEPDSTSSATCSEGLPSLTTMSASALFTRYRTKRKRADDKFATRTHSVKHARYAALSVASQTNAIDSHLPALSEICSLEWALAESSLADFNIDAYTIDCTQSYYDVDVEALVNLAFEVEHPADDILTWSKLAIYAVHRLLLPASIRPVAPALAQSTTLSFDATALAEHDVASLNQLFALTPEHIAIMFESMKAPAPLVTASCIPVEEASPPEESPSPTSSSSSSGCSSPPALSDDSGSSTRSSSVEPGSEQDSLLMSPAALSADYGQLYNELFIGKTSNLDSSQLSVELGTTPDANMAADELSGAADLLARYLQDSMIAA